MLTVQSKIYGFLELTSTFFRTCSKIYFVFCPIYSISHTFPFIFSRHLHRPFLLLSFLLFVSPTIFSCLFLSLKIFFRFFCFISLLFVCVLVGWVISHYFLFSGHLRATSLDGGGCSRPELSLPRVFSFTDNLRFFNDNYESRLCQIGGGKGKTVF
jgi:hypothetical protein